MSKDLRQILGFMAVVTAAAAGWAFFARQADVRITRVSVSMPADEGLRPTGGFFDISTDGSVIVYRRELDDGRSEVWARRLDESGASPIPDTDGAGLPAISPDGLEVAFTASGNPAQVRVAGVQGGASRVSADSAGMGGVRWSPDGAWVYYTNASSGLSRVRSDGGVPEVLTYVNPSVDGQTHWGVDVLPGELIMYTVSAFPVIDPQIEALDLATGETKLVTYGSFARYSDTGHLLFLSDEGPMVMAAPFDVDRGDFTHAPQPVADRVSQPGGRPMFAIAAAGSLLYATARAGPRLTPVWVAHDEVVEEIDPGWEHQGGATPADMARPGPR